MTLLANPPCSPPPTNPFNQTSLFITTMASIYDFAPSGADSAKDTDFSSNFGFVPVIQEEGKTQEQLFEEGLYAYANMEKDARQEARARVIFGKQLVNKEYAPFWIGEAVRRATGQDDILNAYIALDVPIPENVTDPEQLITTLGRNVLDNYSKRFDKIKAEKDSINQAATDVNKLLAGKITPADLTEARNQKIQDIYGYSSFDVHSAAQIINSRKHQNITDQSSSFAGTIGYNLLDIPFRFAESTRAAIGGNLSQAARIMLRGSDSPYDRLAKQYGEIADAAFANNLANDAKFLALAKNPSVALQIAQAEIYKQEKKLLEDATMLGRIGLKTHDALQSVYQGTGDYLAYLGGNIDSALGNETIDVRQSQRVSATVADAELAARSDVQDSRGVLGWMEGGVDWGIENAALFSPWTAAGSTASFFRDNAGRAYNATALPDGSIDESLTPLEVSGKAASSAFINYWSRAIFGKWLPPKISKGLTKMGVNSTIGNFLGTAAVTGTEFATIVPAMDAALRWGYDALAEAFGADPRLADGYKSMLELADNMQTPKHWVTAYTAGSMAAFPGSRAANRMGHVISEIYQCRGLTQQQAEQIRRSTPVHEMAETMQKALEENLSKDKQSVLDNMFTNIRRINDEETKRRKREEGYEVERDLAKQASLRMLGISLADGSDSNHLTIVSGGKLDPITGKYIEGDSRTEYTREDAMLYLGAVFDAYTANLAEHIRHAYFKGKILDALDKNLDGKIEIAAMIDPVALDSIIAKGKQAEALIQSRAKELVEKSKGEDGKPSLSEADARTQASQETHADLHKTHTLAELVNYGKDADMRRQQEITRNRNQDPDRSAMTNVFVISKGNRSDGSLHRIIKIARNASAPELVEDYAEMWMEDYMFLERVDLFDTWRELSALSDHIIKHKQDASLTRGTLTTLRESNPDLAKRLDENAQDFNGDEIAAIRKDVREAFSVLLLSNLREIANNMNSSMQDWIRPMFNAAILSQHTMLQETAIGKALADSAHFGNFENTAHRLLNLTADHLNKLLKEFEAPTVDTYLDAWYKHNETYDRLLDNPQAFTVEQTDAWLKDHNRAANIIEQEEKAKDDERNAPAVEAVKEAQADPANKDLTHEQVVEKVNQQITTAKENDFAERPNSTTDSSATNGKAVETYDSEGLPCRQAMVPIASLKMMPNFKTGSDKDTGEVHPLVGDYHPDHDPIRIFRTTDGELLVISGRHRLAHAKRADAEKIVAYIYDQTPDHDLRWAQLKDIEWNIKDNQATPLDVALLIRGELIDGVPALDAAQVERMGITRKGSQANIGYEIGTKAAPEVIDALRNKPNLTDICLSIAQFAPNDVLVQRKGLAYALEGKGITEIRNVMSIEQSRLRHLAEQGVAIQLNLFNEADFDTLYNDFVSDYAMSKLSYYQSLLSARNVTKRLAKSENANEILSGTGIIFDRAANKRATKSKLNPKEWIEIWKNPWFKDNMEIVGKEIDEAFAEKYPEEWKAMQERKAAEEAAAQEIEQQSTVQGEIPTDTLFGADFSVSSLQAWQIDATLGLGDLGHFAKDFLGRFAPVNDDVIDTKIAAITTALRRRLKELQHVHGNSDVNMLIGEMAAILNQVTQLLPQGYRFGLEPYLEFTNIYAALRKTGDPITSPQSLPMSKWPEIMTQAFRNQVERLLSDRMTPAEREIFFDLYDETTVRADLDKAYQFYIDKRMELVDAVKAKWKNVKRRNEAEQKRYAEDLKQAREQAYNITQAQFADTFNTAYKAVGEMRAHRIISKFLDRAIKKLDQYRKDRTLTKINRALYSITPRIQKDGKPVKGTVSRETYDAALQARRLLMLTPTQKDTIDEAYQAKVEAAEKPAEVEGSIEVSTYDESGKPITFTVPVQVYETYACLESMTAEHAASAAKALGTLISTGKEAWQLKAEQEKAEIDAFCAPIYQKYAETPDQRGKRRNQEMIFLGGKGGIRGLIELTRRLLTGVLNDAQLFDVISATPALSQFKRVQRSIASAHAYIEASEKRNMHNIAKAALAACGFPDADPENLTHEQDKALNKFFTDINDRKALSKAGKTFTFVSQAPDFYKRFKDSERLAFMDRLFKVTRKKDYNPNQLAVLLNYMAENRLVPDDIMQEALDKYGREVDPAIAAKIDIAKAMEYVFPAVKHGHFRNINKTLQEKTAAALEEWNAENKDRKPNVITEMSRNQAAFHVLTTEQADYADMLRQKGYTPELIQQLKDYAGKDMMNLAYSLRELMNARQDTLKAIWESTYGTPFPAVENYYRAFFDVQTKEINDAQMEGFAFGVGGRGEGGMRLFNTRIKHKADIDDRMSATIAFQIGMKQQDNIIAYADTLTHRHLGEFLNRVIANRKDDQELDKVLKAALGEDFHAAFVEHVKNMYRVYGYSDAFASAANRAVRDLGTTAAVSILTARIVSILKNPMAYFNTLGGSDTVNPWEWFKSAARVRLFNTESHGFDISKDSLITDRFKGWDIETLVETIYQHSDVKSSLGTINRYARRGLSAFGAIDRWFTGRSAAIMYDAAYRKFQKLNPEYDAKTLHQLAYGETAMALGMKGQPMDFRQRPLLSTKNSFVTAAYFFLGGEAWSTFGDCARLAIKSLYTQKIPRKQRYHAMANLASVWLVNGFTYALMGLSFNALLDDEEQWKKRSAFKSLGWGSVIGPISGIPILSNLAREAVHLIDPSVYISTPSYLPMSDIRRIVREFEDTWDSDTSALDKAIAWNSTVRNIFTLILLGSQRPTTSGGAKAKAASVVVAAATNAIDFFLRLARAADERWSE